MSTPTPYELHWENLAAHRSRFERGDAAAITVFAGDVRRLDADLTDQQVREVLRILVTDQQVLADVLEQHLPRAIAQVRAT